MKKHKLVIKYLYEALGDKRWVFLLTFVMFAGLSFLSNAYIPTIYQKLIDAISVGKSYQFVIKIFVTLSLLWLVVRVFRFINMYFLSYFESHVIKRLNKKAYEYTLGHSYHYFTNQFTGSLVSKTLKLAQNSIQIFDTWLFNYFGVVVSLISMLIILARQGALIAGVFAIFIVVYVSVVLILTSKIKDKMELRSKANTHLRGIISDSFMNILNLKIFSTSTMEKETFSEANLDQHKKRLDVWYTSTHHRIISSMLNLFFILLILFLALKQWSMGNMTAGSVVLIILYTQNVAELLWGIGRATRNYQDAISDSVETIEMLQEQHEVIDSKNPEKVSIDRGEISLKGIDFSYKDGDHVFTDLNLTIPAGQRVGIIGKSGSGKTTLTKLILRFHDINHGSIQIDGQDISKITQDDLRNSIAYIPQETILFHRSVYENIAYGNQHATKEEILEAAKAAHVDEFIQNFEDGYDTKVGERGVKLSGGQRQRVGIARAMLKKDAPILILDEATSSLDTKSERFIQSSFDSLSKSRTTLVVAHRLSTIQKMDRILVFENGKIVEDGAPADLLANKKGHFRELYDIQNEID